jgi:serine/threonine protein phosphatase PrpC
MVAGPVSAEPEGSHTEDEFLVMGCDGIWDVLYSAAKIMLWILHAGSSKSTMTRLLAVKN